MNRSTLSIAKDLEANGFTRPQAESLAEVILEATENDISDLVTKDYLDTKISTVKSELKLEIAGVRTELKADIAETRTEIRDSKIATIKWMVGLQFVGFGFTVGFIYFLMTFLLKHAKLLEKLLVAAQTA